MLYQRLDSFCTCNIQDWIHLVHVITKIGFILYM